ncbi:ABC transporter ATP-binding protein/permease [Leucobacter sp. NPDC058333]|uniref:ABC transporter ATP-binding protein/permease n=1 Tax=Leucobacter sp. NPDC058333 TaxID=3346450 RepID=UPI0036493D0C
MMIVRELWREASRFPALLLGSIVLAVLVFACHVAQAVAIAAALSAMVTGNGAAVITTLVWVAGIAAIRVGIGTAQSAVAALLGGKVRRELRGRAVRSTLVARRLRDVDARDGALRVALTDGIDGTDTYVSKYIPAVAQLAITCPGVVIALAVVNLWAGVWIAIALLLALLGPLAWKRLMSRRGLDHWDSYEALSADLLDALRGMATLRTLGDVPGTRRRIHARSEALRTATERVMRVSLAETGIIDFAIQAGVVVAALVAIVDAATGRPPALETYLILLLASEAFRPIRELSRHWHAGFLGLTAVPGLRGLGAFETGAGERDAGGGCASGAAPAADPNPVSSSSNSLRVNQLRFRYDSATEPVLDGLDLTAHRGELTAIVGSSGAGKSTLFDVLLGFLTPEAGSAELDGAPLRPSDIAVVSQRPVLFAGTVRDNVDIWGSASDPELVNACRAAGILDEVLRLPNGMDSAVSEAGLSLSGGQRQRLALARALLTRRPVLLVDEPTSALDTDRAAEVMATLRAAAADRIVVMITHRPESLHGVDRLLRLNNGRLDRVPAW